MEKAIKCIKNFGEKLLVTRKNELEDLYLWKYLAGGTITLKEIICQFIDGAKVTLEGIGMRGEYVKRFTTGDAEDLWNDFLSDFIKNTKEKTMEKNTKAEKMNIFQRINAVMHEVSYVQKEKQKEQGLKYRVLAHDTVTAALHPQLSKHGIVACTSMDYSGSEKIVTITVKFVNIDDPNDSFTTSCPIPVTAQTPVAFGGAYSYGYKFALLKTFMLESGEEEMEVIEKKREDDEKRKQLLSETKAQKESGTFIPKDKIYSILGDLKDDEKIMAKLLKNCAADRAEEIPASFEAKIAAFAFNVNENRAKFAAMKEVKHA